MCEKYSKVVNMDFLGIKVKILIIHKYLGPKEQTF